MASVAELAESLVKLTLLEAVELKNLLKEKGIEPAAGGGGFAGPAGPAAPAAKVEEPTEFNVILESVDPAKKIFAELGLNVQETSWSGPTMLCWGADSVKSLAINVDTAVKESRKDPKAPEKYKIKGAVADGAATTLEIAKTMPTRLEAIGEVLQAILGPGATLAASITGPGATVVNLLTAIEEKAKETAAVPEAAPAA